MSTFNSGCTTVRAAGVAAALEALVSRKRKPLGDGCFRLLCGAMLTLLGAPEALLEGAEEGFSMLKQLSRKVLSKR
jgi:hypothetical protein